jgi:hypothetical protein
MRKKKMKIREGFVSNSSSASFILKKRYLSEKQIWQVRNHIDKYRELGIEYPYQISRWDAWHLVEDEDLIEGDTSMTNFDMEGFFETIGIPEEAYRFYSD